jgi:hypothetical protein
LYQALKLVIIAIVTTIIVIAIIIGSANTLTLRGVLVRGVGTCEARSAATPDQITT